MTFYYIVRSSGTEEPAVSVCECSWLLLTFVGLRAFLLPARSKSGNQEARKSGQPSPPESHAQVASPLAYSTYSFVVTPMISPLLFWLSFAGDATVFPA